MPHRKRNPVRPDWQPWSNVVPSQLRLFCFLWQFIKFSFIAYLCHRQGKVLDHHREIPQVLRKTIPRENFERARSYHISLNNFKMFSCFYWMLHEALFIFLAGFTGLWFISGPILDFFRIWPDDWDRETGESLVFIWLLVLHINIVQMPLSLWKTFRVEDEYGFNNLTLRAYLWDWCKMVGLECLFGTFVGISILWIVMEAGRHFVVWLWLISFIWMLVYLGLYPNLIAPIFDTYTPLRDGKLKDRLRRLAHFLGFPLEDILILHQSWRSEHRKAYFYGLMEAKRIVLYDTLLDGYPAGSLESIPSVIVEQGHLSQIEVGAAGIELVVTGEGEGAEGVRNREIGRERSRDLRAARSREVTAARSRNVQAARSRDIRGARSMELRGGRSMDLRAARSRNIAEADIFSEREIEAIVARLMGRWILGHTLKELVYPMVSMFLFYLLFSAVYGAGSSLYHAFASLKDVEQIDKPILLGLRLLYADVMDVYMILVGWLMKHFDRQRYYEADAFATKLGYGEELIKYYIKSEKENLEYPYFDSWYWSFHFREPSSLKSIEAIEEEIERLEWQRD